MDFICTFALTISFDCLGIPIYPLTIKSINLKFLGTYNSNSINRYIGNLISIYADHVDNDYTEHLKLLREKDDSLFSIITDFWNSESDYKYELK